MPPPTSQSPDTNYDFIFNNGQKPRRSFNFLTDGSKKQRVIIISVGAVIVLILFIIISSILSSAGSGNVQQLTSIAEQQQEMIRVSTVGTNKATTSGGRNLAITSLLHMTTAQQQVMIVLKDRHALPNQKILALKHSVATDNTLNAADLNNNFDNVFGQVMQTELTNYRNSLKAAYGSSTTSGERQILNTAYKSAGILLGESNQLAQQQ